MEIRTVCIMEMYTESKRKQQLHRCGGGGMIEMDDGPDIGYACPRNQNISDSGQNIVERRFVISKVFGMLLNKKKKY